MLFIKSDMYQNDFQIQLRNFLETIYLYQTIIRTLVRRVLDVVHSLLDFIYRTSNDEPVLSGKYEILMFLYLFPVKRVAGAIYTCYIKCKCANRSNSMSRP